MDINVFAVVGLFLGALVGSLAGGTSRRQAVLGGVWAVVCLLALEWAMQQGIVPWQVAFGAGIAIVAWLLAKQAMDLRRHHPAP